MPIRPADPNDPVAFWNDIRRRVEDLERRSLGLPPGDGPLQTFEDGSPLGDTRFLDFGAGVQATLVGDDYVLIEGAGAGGISVEPWDAVVDVSLVASDPDNHLFKGIFEAIDFCAVTLALTRANIFVRPGTYTETANLSNTPSQVVLFSPGGDGPSVTGALTVTWNHAGFTLPTAAYFIYNMTIASGAKGQFFGNTGASSPDIYLFRCGVDGDGAASPFRFGPVGQGTFMIDCLSFNGPYSWGADVMMVGCDLEADARSVTLAETKLSMFGCRVGVGGTATWTIPSETTMVFAASTTLRNGTHDSGTLTLSGTSSLGVYHVDQQGKGGRVTLTISGGPSAVVAKGLYSQLTLGAADATSGKPHSVDVNMGNIADITGPATVVIRYKGGGGPVARIRGKGVSGLISGANDTGSSGAFVSFLDADESSLIIAASGVTATGTRKPYEFDASSANNVLVMHGLATWPAAGTDAGTNNRVLPEGSAPPAGGMAPADADYLVGTANAELSAEIVVGATPGGELGGTWAAPTVDATHSGSAHTDFIAKALVDAKGDVITATADNTPVRKAVGADGTALVASAAAGDGLVWGTPAVLNFAAATTPGTVVGKVEIFDAAGASLGFLPVYDAIT